MPSTTSASWVNWTAACREAGPARIPILQAVPSRTGKLRVVHFQRKPMPGNVSIERLFADIRDAMPRQMECSPHVCPYFSKGILPRIKNMLDAARNQGQLNHITGDVHYLALMLDKRRTLLTIHDCASLERLRGLRRAVLRFFWFTLPMRRARLVTVISEATRRELLRHVHFNPARIRVVQNCVGKDFVPFAKPFDVEEPNVLHLGTSSNKNLERLIQALAGLRCRLSVIGKLTGVQHELLRRSAIIYSNIPRATDSQVLDSYRTCDLVAFASTYEGFGLPILEAQATGRPVITSNVSSMPEVAGSAACIVDPFNVESIRGGILRVWHDAAYRQSLVEAGFENVKRFRPEAVAAKYAELYEELAECK
jgi:glycosyltransferase involved in cell wall biosynthesis